MEMSKLFWIFLMGAFLAGCIGSTAIASPIAEFAQTAETPLPFMQTPSPISSFAETMAANQTQNAVHEVSQQALSTEIAKTPSSTPSSSFLTPLPTLAPEAAKEMAYELLMSNMGCQLPCWWGIIPGQSEWASVRRFLETFGYVGNQTKYISTKFELPERSSYEQISVDFVVADGFVHSIESYIFKDIEWLHFDNFIFAYGQPDEIWVSALYEDVPGYWLASFSLFYKDKGIVIDYAVGGEVNGEEFLICPRGGEYAFLGLWAPSMDLSFMDAIDYFGWNTDGSFKYHSIIELGLDVATFFGDLLHSDESVCIGTPLVWWGVTP